jgi:maltose alpha-D-glucosyltransferase/alpha-amylase
MVVAAVNFRPSSGNKFTCTDVHRFYDFPPDLDTANPGVHAELLKIMGFWIQLDVSGFRMDAVPFVIAKKGPKVHRPVEQNEMLRAFREFLRWREGNAIILVEANVLPDTDLAYFGDAGERLPMMFNFQLNQNTFYTLATGDTKPLKKALLATKPRPASAQWRVFLRNHDELDLGRLTPEQRAAAFGPEPDMQLYGRGIRRRLAPMLAGDRRRLELAYSLMLTLPGTPVIRYGDEIGIGDDLRRPERGSTRTPMQWSAEPQGGFTKHPKSRVPVTSGGAYGFERINVASQRRDPESFLNWIERMIRMRREMPEISWRDFEVLRASRNDVLALRYDWRNNSVLCLHNFGAAACTVRFHSGFNDPREDRLINLLSDDHSEPGDDGRHAVVLEPYGYRWYRVGGLDYLLRRAEA